MAKSKVKAKKKAPDRRRAKATAKKTRASSVKKAARKASPKVTKKKKPAARKPSAKTKATRSKQSSPKSAAKQVSHRSKTVVKPTPVDEPPALIPVPLPEGVRPQRTGEPSERSAHLEKLKQLFDSAPISRYLGMTLGYCENGVARVRLPFRKDFEEGHGVIHGGLIGLLADTAGNFAVGSVSPGSTVKTVEFKLSLLAGVQGDLLAIGEVVRKGRTLATCRLEVVEGNDRVVAIGLATYALQAV
jgi:uncharacterized protein (TIGR00369 family)